jgi:hypothetical protein
VRCLSVTTADCPFANGNRSAFCGACGFSSENVLIVSDEEYKPCVPNDGTSAVATSLERLEASGDVNVVSIDVLPNTDASAKFYLINTGGFDAESVTVTFTGVDGHSETRTLSVPVFHPRTAPVEFVVPIRVKAQRAGEVAVGMFSVSYIPRKGTSRSYTRRVVATVPSPAEMHVSCELMTFSQRIRTRTFKISNLGGLPGYVIVDLRGDTTQWGLSYLPNNGFGYAPANLLQYLIPARGFLKFQVTCNGQAYPGAISITGDGTNHSIVLSYDGERIQQNVNRPIYMVGIDLGTRQTSAVIRYLPLGQEPPEPVMVDLSKSGQDGEVRVETKITVSEEGAVACGTDLEGSEQQDGFVIHELKSLLYEATHDPFDKDYERWWNANLKMHRFSYSADIWSEPDSYNLLFRSGVTIYEQLMRWTFPYVNWLRMKVRETIDLRSKIAQWPEYGYVKDSILWVFTVPVRDFSLGTGSSIAVGYNRYLLTLLRVLCRANWCAPNTTSLAALIDKVSEDQDLANFLDIVERDYRIRFEVESVAAITGVYNHPVSHGQFSAGLVGRNVYLIDSGGGTSDVVQVTVGMNEDDRKLIIKPIEILGQDTEGEVFGGELISTALISYFEYSSDITHVFVDKGINREFRQAFLRVVAEDAKKLRPKDLSDDFGRYSERFTWGTLRNIPSVPTQSKDWTDALSDPARFVTARVPPNIDVIDNRSITRRMDSLLNAIESRFQLGSAVTDDYYLIVGGNSKFVPLQAMVHARLGRAMNELLSAKDEAFDKVRELFVCYGSVFVRDTKSIETYDYPILMAVDGQECRELQPGQQRFEQFTCSNAVFSIRLYVRRIEGVVAVVSSLVSVNPNTPVVLRLQSTIDSISITVNGNEVVQYDV